MKVVLLKDHKGKLEGDFIEVSKETGFEWIKKQIAREARPSDYLVKPKFNTTVRTRAFKLPPKTK